MCQTQKIKIANVQGTFVLPVIFILTANICGCIVVLQCFGFVLFEIVPQGPYLKGKLGLICDVIVLITV